MNSLLWYDRQGQPLTTEQADALLSDPKYKRVALTEVTSTSDSSANYRVSTVWLGLDHSHSSRDVEPPILFETMAFGGGEEQDQTMWRWHTEDEARAGHAEIVASVAATVTDEAVTDLDDWPKAD